MCATESTDPERIVFRDATWAAEVVPGYEVPGWFVLRARRHVEGIGALDDHEADAFGRRARDLMTAIGQVTGAPTTYLMGFGENYRHFHVLIAARGDDIPADRRGARIVQLRTERADLDNSLRVAAEVRGSYEQLTTRAPI
jgi:diadenosine tetraphosphate (Ap4A) HIT family hydrolase